MVFLDTILMRVTPFEVIGTLLLLFILGALIIRAFSDERANSAGSKQTKSTQSKTKKKEESEDKDRKDD